MRLKPLRTEKTHKLAAVGRYTFAVDLGANKTQIKHLIEKTFGVNVTKMQTLTMPGKSYRTGRKGIKATRSDWKKAIATVKSGQKIDLFETA
ncbi:MAG: 50S ribosomal protein L23 [bacterium]|nr:50S ribosomal protein L23 [bacterium]